MTRPGTAQAGEHPDLRRLHARPASRLADAVSTVLDPPVVVLLSLVVLTLVQLWPRWAAAAAWLALAGALVVVLPLALRALFLRRGWVSDAQVVRREERLALLGAVAACLAGSAAVLGFLGAPPGLLAVVGSMLLGSAVFTLVSVWWKVSFHVGTLAAQVALWGLGLTQWAWPLGAALVALLGWARWRAGRHSLAQVVVGALLGAVLGLASGRAAGLA